MIRQWLLKRYIRQGTKSAKVNRRRLLTTWCDYEPAHYSVKYVALVDGQRFGQSCMRHLGALTVDAQRAGGIVVIEPVEPVGPEPEPSRLTPMVRA